MSEHDETTVCLNVHEPIGVVGQIFTEEELEQLEPIMPILDEPVK